MHILTNGVDMLKTATNIIKGVFRHRNQVKHNFPRISWIQEKVMKHQEDKRIKVFTSGNLSIYYKRPYELIHSYKEIFEKEIYRFNSHKTNPTIFDCGSNIGLSVMYFKQLFPGAHIIAFEPDEQNFNILKLNIEKNGIDNIDLNKKAVWINDGTIMFASNESEASHIATGGTGHVVPTIKLSRLLKEIQEIDFLKIDIEGAESEVMEDITPYLGKVKNLFLEYHGKATETSKLNRMLEQLNNAGFMVYIRNAADNLCYPFIEKQTGTIYDVQLNIFCYKS